MAGRYKAYSDYKEFNSTWFDALPCHWQSVSMRWIANLYAGGTPSKDNLSFWENGSIPWLNSGAVNQSHIEKPSAFITRDAFNNSSAKWIPEESLVMALAGQGKTKGLVAQLAIKSTCNQSMAAIVPSHIVCNRFLFWWLTSNYQKIRNMAGGDLRDGLNLDLLKSISCPIFDLKEQQKIANFLDHETAKIDTLIAKQEKLIELLKEKRQAVISHAVTKGLNPNAPMRDSGVEWLGEVPEHWVTSSIKYLSSFVGTGGTPKNQSSFVDDKDAIKWFAPGDFSDQIDLIQSSKHISYEAVTSGDAKLYKENSVLVIGIGATLGKVALCKNKFSCNQQINMITPNEKATAEFITYSLLAQHEQMKQSSNASTIGIMNQEKTKSIKVAQPPISEQVEIVNDLNIALEKFELIEAKAVEQIDLLKERKTALISAAVTGKIDVRDFVSEQGQPQGIQG